MPELIVRLVSGIVFAVVVVASLGCVGLSDEDVDQIIAEIAQDNEEALKEYEEALAHHLEQYDRAQARYEARVQDIVDNHRTHLDEQMIKVREYIEYETDDIWARTNESNQEAIDQMVQNQLHLVKTICETDYWVTTVVGMLSAMIRDGATTEELEGFFAGALIDADYATYSGVCQADGDQRWQLIPQPDKIPPNRFE